MDQFSRWSGIAHALLSQQSSRVRLGQIHQLLAACLGHRTYASFRAEDHSTLNQQPHYVLFDDAAGLSRASELGLRIAPEAWKKVTLELKPSGITPFWLTTKSGMHSAARVAFEDSADDRISSIKSAMGFPDGHRATSSRCHSEDDDLPVALRFDVFGEAHGYSETESLATPVTVVVEFPRIGRRIYGDGVLVSVEQSGVTFARDPDDDNGGDVFWMSED